MSRVPTDPEMIRALAAILNETGLTEIEIADKDNRVRVVRAPAAMAQVAAPMPVAYAAPAPAAASAPPPQPSEEQLASKPGAVTSPMVGVVYLSPEPGSPVFVNIGQQVTAGQTVLLIEAMKTFNQIKAPIAGTVTRILIANGSPVEYGEVLMLIEP